MKGIFSKENSESEAEEDPISANEIIKNKKRDDTRKKFENNLAINLGFRENKF